MRAVVAVAGDLESLVSLLWFESGRGPVLASGDVATVRAAVEDAGAALVTVPAGDGWRCYVREGECAVSVTGPELEDAPARLSLCGVWRASAGRLNDGKDC